jgi:hypothetical protein
MRRTEKIMKISELNKFGSESLSGIKILLQNKEKDEKDEKPVLNAKKSERTSRAGDVKMSKSL